MQKRPVSWKKITEDYGLKSILDPIRSRLAKISNSQKTIYPARKKIFRAFDLTSFDNLKVVILGQDPYHGYKQANGLAFSVDKNIKIPPSLINIYKEYSSDLGFSVPINGNLESWAKQGVLLLNSILTVEPGSAGSHKDIGWEVFTDEIIRVLSKEKVNLVFILWGAYAQTKNPLIASSKHLVISSPHPSPLSAYKGFFGSKPFSKCNKYLKENNIKEIDWKL